MPTNSKTVLTEEGAPTNRQMQVLAYILGCCDKGIPPTVREIEERFGMSSPNSVLCHLAALRKHGFITTDRKIARGIRPLVRLELYGFKDRLKQRRK